MGKKLPTKEILRNCFTNNSDGAGFSFVQDNRIYISKGYVKFKPFFRAIKRHIGDDTSAILHFRIASVGEVSRENCHPFVIADNKKEINKTVNCTKKPVFAHNGTLPIRAKDGKSDTRQYAHIIGDPLIRNNIFRNKSLMHIMGESIGSGRMAFMNRKGDIKLLGDFEEEDGISFSNRSYKYSLGTITKYSWSKKTGKLEKEEDNAYGDDYDDYGYGGYYGRSGGWKKGWKKDTFEPVEEEKEKNEPKKEVATILLPESKAKSLFERYPISHADCEVCGSKEHIWYYPKLDTSLCQNCYNLYYEGFNEGDDEEVVNE